MLARFMKRITTILFVLCVSTSVADVYHSKQSALKEAFPSAQKIDEQTIYLSDEDAAWIKQQAGTSANTRTIRVFIAKDSTSAGANTLGYAFIDTHPIRTFSQSIMLVIDANGALSKTIVLAFHEPLEYKAPARWWKQFLTKKHGQVPAAVDGITGATMTANSSSAAVRRTLAIVARKLASK